MITLPHAGGMDFDDSKFEILDPRTLIKRRSTDRICFNWYGINLTIPEKIEDLTPLGLQLCLRHLSTIMRKFG